MAQPAPHTSFETLTAYCKATADQQRLQILRILSRDSFGVLELCHILGTAQPALSHHLKVLADSRLVETRRQGTSSFYRRALISQRDPIRDLRQSLFRTVDEFPIGDEQQARMAEIHEQRREHARAFFQKNADRFQENQDLIAEYPVYADCVASVLEEESGIGSVVEVGPGESALICELAVRYPAVVGIDNSEEMLQRAQKKVAAAGAGNVKLLEGELADGPEPVDLIVLNMVLHHLASPADLFETAHQKLAPGGRLLIADLSAHDQDWTRDACGDLWLGFEADELDSWATLAGLQPTRCAFVGLKNGFQVQVHLFTKTD